MNAPVVAKARGVQVALTTDTESPDHRSLVRVRTTLTDGRTVTVAGTVAGARHTPKLVQVDGFDLDVAISEHMAFIGYIDRPGVVGTMGRLLGEQGINIAGMQVGRTGAGGDALTVLTVDSAIPAGRAGRDRRGDRCRLRPGGRSRVGLDGGGTAGGASRPAQRTCHAP